MVPAMTTRPVPETTSLLLERLGFDPVEPYPGNRRTAWALKHRRCGRVVKVSVKLLSAATGTGCRSCSATDRNYQRDPMTGGQSWEQRARADLAQVEMEPLEPYPGMRRGWRCRHRPCGREAVVQMSALRAGRRACLGCGTRLASAIRKEIRPQAPALSHVEASAVLEAGGFVALEKYPGSRYRAWRARHLACGQELMVSLAKLRLVREQCPYCRAAPELARPVHARGLTVSEAMATMRAAGLEPLVPYPGRADMPWLSKHLACGRVVTPRLGNLRAGHEGCASCAIRRGQGKGRNRN